MSSPAQPVPQPLGRPLPAAAAALCAGIWAAESLHDAGAPRFVALTGLLALSIAVVVRRRDADAPWWKRLGLRWALVGLALFFADLRVEDALRVAADRIDRLAQDGAEVTVEGWIDEEVVNDVHVPAEVDYDGRPFLGRVETAARTALVVETLAEAGGAPRAASGRVAYYAGEPLPDLVVGTRVRVQARFAAPRGARNPWGPDRKLWARRQHEAGALQGKASGVEILAAAPGSARAFFLGVKRRLAAGLIAACGREDSRLARCIVLGERTVLTDDEAQDFLRSGTVHFLAVSGLNVALAAGLLGGLAALLGARRAGRGAAALVGAVLYAGVTGLQAPVTRAALMVASYLTGDLVGRRRDGPSALALAALALLLYDPFTLFDPGFLLSFVSVGAIAAAGLFVGKEAPADPLEALAPPSRARLALRAGWRGVRAAARVSLAAWLGVLPLTLIFFFRVSGAAVPASLLLGPLVALLLATGIFAALAGTGAWLVVPPSRLILDLAHGFGHLPGALWALPIPGPFATAAYYAAWVCACEARRSGDRRARWLGAGIALAGAFAWLMPEPAVPAGTFRCTIFDVGHGTLALVETAERTLLFDAGGAGGNGLERRVLEPYARHRGIGRIDVLALSHADFDHVSAVPGILDAFGVGEIAVSPRFALSPLGKEILLRCDRAGVPVRTVVAGNDLALGAGITAEVLWPPPVGGLSAGLSDNDGALVVRVSARGRALWLTGDVEHRGWEKFLATGPPPTADVLLVPHHGSAGAWHPALARALHPVGAVISSDARFHYREVAASFRALGARVLVTAEVGAVVVEEGEARAWDEKK